MVLISVNKVISKHNNHRMLIIVLVHMIIFTPLAIDIFLPALPVMAESFRVDLTMMQLTVSVYILSLGCGQLFWGPLADRLGRRSVALMGVLLYISAALATAIVTLIELHLLARFVQGIGACAIAVAAFATVRDYYDPVKSGVVFSYLNGAICCIPALAPILGDMLTEQLGWRANFYCIAIYGVFAGLIIYRYLLNTQPQQSQQSQQKDSLFLIKSYWQVAKHPTFLFNSLVIMMSMSVIIAYVSSSPAWLMVELGLSQSEFVYWFSMNAVVNIIACLLAPRILISFGPWLTCGVGMFALLCAGVLMFGLLAWSDPVAYMFPILLSSLGFSFLMGTCSGQALGPFPNIAGTAAALLGFIQMSGSALLVFLVQQLPINPAEQVGLLMLACIPFLMIWCSSRFKSHIILDS